MAKKVILVIVTFSVLAMSLSGCNNRRETLGTVGGAAVGGTIGALAGGTTGAVIGAAGGAVVGNVIAHDTN